MVKVDFQKAYDCVSWDYPRYIIGRIWFGAKWMFWMEMLVLNNSLSILVNNSPIEDFQIRRGLRQRGHYPPLFFFLQQKIWQVCFITQRD